jgi:5-methylcytosine-specific restriction endonuclease McrA
MTPEYYKEHREDQIMRMREHRKRRRLEHIKYLGGKCVKCGITERLEFDHINKESKEFSIGSRVAMKTNKLKEELDKCQLLCYDCHLEKTLSERININKNVIIL